MKLKTRHKLLPAVVALLIATLVMSTSTYAWFTMNNTVTATGMSMTIVSPTNLLISDTNAANSYADTATITADQSTTENPADEAKLIPASSTTGVNLFYTTDIEANEAVAATYGQPKADATFTAVTAAQMVGATTPVTDTDDDGYYYDYKFWVKNTGDAEVDVYVTNINIEKPTAEDTIDITNAVRFAILTQDETPAAFNDDNGVFGKRAHDDANMYFAALTGAINAAGNAADNYKGVETTYNYDGTPAACFQAPGNATNGGVIGITVRVWLEGQDSDCITSKAGSGFKISFDLTTTAPASALAAE